MPDKPPLTLVEPGTDSNPDSGDASDSTHEQRIADLESSLSVAAAKEAELVQQLEDQRTRRAELIEQVRSAHQDAIAASAAEATRRHDAIVAEAESFYESSRQDALREAKQITDQALSKAETRLAEAKEEAEAVIAERLREFASEEAAAEQRIEELESQEAAVRGRLEIAQQLYEELQDTLKAVAEASIKELAEAKTSMAQIQPPASPLPRRRAEDARHEQPADKRG